MMLGMKTLHASIIFVFVSTGVFAQSANSGYSATVTSSWNRLARLLVASAEAMPENSYAYKPTADVRTYGELIGHLAEEHYIFCSGLKGEKNPKESVKFEKLANKAEFVKALNESIEYCNPVYAAAKDDAKMIEPKSGRRDTPFSSLLMNVTHDSEHYGNLVTYLRMKGIVPPSSQPSR
jgi:uncharacterized damage-inducible protein DinB